MPTTELEWSDRFTTDIVSIDQQHEQLIYLSQSLLNLLYDGKSPLVEKQTAFKSLVDHTVAHFEYEERIMKNIGYPNSEEHIKEHHDILAEVNKMSISVICGENEDNWKGLVSLIQVWVLRHIVASDMPISKFIQRTSDKDWLENSQKT